MLIPLIIRYLPRKAKRFRKFSINKGRRSAMTNLKERAKKW